MKAHSLALLVLPCLLAALWQPALAEDAPAGSAQAPAPEVKPPERLKVLSQVVGKGGIDMGSLRADKRFYVQMADSPTLTGAMRESFKALGFQLVDSAEEAEVKLAFKSDYTFHKSRLKPNNVNYAKAYESGVQAMLAAKKDESGPAGTLDLGVTAMAAQGTIAPALFGAFNIVDTIFDATGIKARLNKFFSGDERGTCIFGCSDWNKYWQGLRVEVVIEPKEGEKAAVATVAQAFDERLLPNELFQLAMKEMNAKLLPNGAGPVPAAPPGTPPGPQPAPAAVAPAAVAPAALPATPTEAREEAPRS